MGRQKFFDEHCQKKKPMLGIDLWVEHAARAAGLKAGGIRLRSWDAPLARVEAEEIVLFESSVTL